MEPWFIAVFVVASVGGSALIIFALRMAKQSRDALKQMAEAEGWTFDFRGSTGGRGAETVIRDPNEGWVVTMYVHSGTTSGSSSSTGASTRWTSFEAPGLAVEGLAVIGPDIPEKTKQMANTMLGMMGGDIGLFILNKITGGLGKEAQGVRTIDRPGPGTLMASPGAEDALDGVREAPALIAAALHIWPA